MKTTLLVLLALPIVCFGRQYNHNIYKKGDKLNICDTDTLVGNVHYKHRQACIGKIDLNISAGYLTADDPSAALPQPDGDVKLYIGALYKITELFSITRWFSLGVYFERDKWEVQNTQYGLVANFKFNHFYFGIDGGPVVIKNFFSYPYETTFENSFARSLHAGLIQSISKHVYLKEELAYKEFLYKYYINSNVLHMPDHFDNKKIRSYYFMVGISYMIK